MKRGFLKDLSSHRGVPGVVVLVCGVLWNVLDTWDTASFAMEKVPLILPAVRWLGTVVKPYWTFYGIGLAMMWLQYSAKDADGDRWRNRRIREDQEPARFVTLAAPSVNIEVDAGHVEVRFMVLNGTSVDISLRDVLPDRKMSFALVDHAWDVPTGAAAMLPVSEFTFVGSTEVRTGEVSTITVRQHLPPAMLTRLVQGLADARVLFIFFRWSDFVFVGEDFRYRMVVPDVVYQAARSASFVVRRS